MDKGREVFRAQPDGASSSASTGNQSRVESALETLSASLGELKQAVEYRLTLDNGNVDLHSEINRLNDDRKHLAARLDQADGRLRAHQKATAEVSERLGVAMDTIRTVLEKQAK